MKAYLLACALGVIAYFPSVSEARVYRCDTCQVDSDFEEVARTLGPGQQHLIFNLHDNLLQMWWVPHGTPVLDPKAHDRAYVQSANNGVVKISPPATAIDELGKAHTVYVIGGGTLRPVINVPIFVLDLPSAQNKTAYDVVLDANLTAMIESAAGRPEVISTVTGTNLISAVADLTNLATSYLGLRDQAALLFRIVMTDGSYFHIRIDLQHPNGDFLEDTARTASGQLIPTSLQDVQGEWSGAVGDDLGLMVNHMQQLGATVNFVGPTGGLVRTIVCSGSGAAKICIAETVIP